MKHFQYGFRFDCLYVFFITFFNFNISWVPCCCLLLYIVGYPRRIRRWPCQRRQMFVKFQDLGWKVRKENISYFVCL